MKEVRPTMASLSSTVGCLIGLWVQVTRCPGALIQSPGWSSAQAHLPSIPPVHMAFLVYILGRVPAPHQWP